MFSTALRAPSSKWSISDPPVMNGKLFIRTFSLDFTAHQRCFLVCRMWPKTIRPWGGVWLICFRYSSALDMWSLGCIVVELFLGLPLFPGSSEYNQVCRIVEMLGLPPTWMLEMGKQSGEFFEKTQDEFGRKTYRLKSLEQYSREHNTKEQPSKKYFQASTLEAIIRSYPMPRKNMKPAEVERGTIVNYPLRLPRS